MALVIRATSPAQVRSGSGPQDFTVTGFGTPQAAIVMYYTGGSADTDNAHRLHGIGFYDGTSQACAYSYGHDASVATNRTASGTHQDILYVYTAAGGGNAIRSSTAASFITDGLQITFDGGTPQPYVTVVLIKGATGVKAGYFSPSASADGTEVVTTTGVNPNALICVNSYASSIDGNDGTGLISVGVAGKIGTSPYSQHCLSHYDNTTPTGVSARVYQSGAVAASFNNGTVRTRYELTDFGTGSFTVTSRTGSTTESKPVAYLALELPAVPDVFMATAPVGTGDFDPYAGTGKPEAVFMVASAATVVDTSYSLGEDAAEGFGLYVATRNSGDDSVLDEFGLYGISEDGVSTSNTSNRYGTSLIVQSGAAGAPTFQASSPSFDSSGVLYSDANTSAASAAYKIFGIAFRDTSLTKKLKISVHPDAASASGVEGIVWADSAGIAGAEIGEFTGKTFEASTEGAGDAERAVLKVPVADFGGGSLAVDDVVPCLVRNATYTTGLITGTVIEE